MDPSRWEQIRAAFDALIALDPASRASRLAELGATDPELRRAIQSLLAADADADRQLLSLETAFPPPATPAPDLLSLAGHSISHFHVFEPIGAGGMGVVYRAEDTRLGRTVALKFLLPHFGLDPSAKERFLREAHSAAALDHPNLCTIYEVGDSEDGHPFLAMALYPGETLKSCLAREGPLPIGDALAITRQIAGGLACAHAAGIVHRDLKPGNVMLVSTGPVKILDFGLARALDESLSTVSARMGTPAYMAPEQVQGEAVDARTDLWALGVVLYEVLTGRNPFDREHEVAVAHAILVDEPVPPSTHRADVSAELDDLVLSLLQKNPASRYPAADRLLAQLAEIETRVESADRSTGTRPSRAMRLYGTRRRKVAITAAAIGVVGVLVGAALVARRNGARSSEAASRVVVMPFENRTVLTELDPLGPMAAEWITQGLTEVPFLTVLDTRMPGAGAGPVTVGRETGAGVVVAGAYFLQGDSLQFQAQIVSTVDGRILLGIGVVAVPRDRPLDGIEGVRQRVATGLASWLDRDVTTFQTSLRQPPTYAAYLEYVEGLKSYMGGEVADAARHFQLAATLDSSFLGARIWAAQAGILGGWSLDDAWVQRADSLLNGLQPIRDRLSLFDRARLDFVVALRAGDSFGSYQAALGLVTAAPGSVDARREAAQGASRVLRPREALKRYQELDPKRGLMRGWESEYWYSIANQQHRLGEYEAELIAIRRARQLEPGARGYLYGELRALAALGRIVEFDSLVRAELPATWSQRDLFVFGLAGELIAHGHPDAAHRLAQNALDHPGASPPFDPVAARDWLLEHMFWRRVITVPYCYLGEPVEQNLLPGRARDEWLHWRVELALLLGHVDQAAELSTQLHDPEAHGLLRARVLAAAGKLGDGRATMERWERRMLQSRGTLNGLEMERAAALVRLGDRERALEILAEGIGRRPLPNATNSWNGHAYPEFGPLLSDPRFQALIKPRG